MALVIFIEVDFLSGIIASSIGTILKSYGVRVTAIKIDPYLNIDAGTFSPYEHGNSFIIRNWFDAMWSLIVMHDVNFMIYDTASMFRW